MAQAKSDGLIYGSTGVGSAAHFIAELFKKQAQIPTLVHVPFRGSAPLAQELLGGRVDFAMASVASIVSQVEAGNVIALAAASELRSPNFKDLPTFAEMGVQNAAADAWFTIFAPAGTPKDIVDLLEREILRALDQDDVKKTIVELGMIPSSKPGAVVAKELPAEITRWTAIAKDAGMKPE
jgi:tripartite-type tricarboxylate transporter receptor subunit TctC